MMYEKRTKDSKFLVCSFIKGREMRLRGARRKRLASCSLPSVDLSISHPITGQFTSRPRGVPSTQVLASEIDSITEARFWAMVKIDWAFGACWEWTGRVTTEMGYGRFKLGRRRVSANRVAYALFNGETPKGMFVCHKCDNPACVRDDHLFLGTPTENMLDRNSKLRHAFGSRTGTSILDESQVIEIKRLLTTDLTARQIGSLFGVGKSTIQKISQGVNWGHLVIDAGYEGAPLLSYAPPAATGRPGHTRLRLGRPAGEGARS